MRNVYICVQNAGYFEKSKIICVMFYSQKSRHITLRYFYEDLELAFIYIQKSWQFALRDGFIYKKPDTLKKEDNLRYVLYMRKTWRFALHGFSWDFWNWRRVGGFY